MGDGPHHEIADLKSTRGELSFEARIGGREMPIWLRTSSDVTPTADAALAACLMPAMRFGGGLTMAAPVSPRLLEKQREFQAVQQAWSRGWSFGDPPLREVEVVAPTRVAEPRPEAAGRVAAFFSAGVDSWSTVLGNPDVTDLIFVRGFDLAPGAPHQAQLVDEVERRLRDASRHSELHLHVVETNLREHFDQSTRWEAYYGSAIASVAHFLAPLFEKVLVASGTDHEAQEPIGTARLISHLWNTEQLEIVDDGGRYDRVERTRRVAEDPVAQRTLRVCWETPGGAYNCGKCQKCLMTMVTLEALGVRPLVTTFPAELDLEAIAALELQTAMSLYFWEDILDATRAASRPDLERAVGAVVSRGKQRLGRDPGSRCRRGPGPPPTVRIAAIVPVWRQAQYMAAAVGSALEQRIDTGVGVVIVNDGCPDPNTHRFGQALRDANPERVVYLRQANRGLSAARNAGIQRALTRWPHVEAVFPLDADNMLSGQTLARLSAVLEERPEVAWATPTLELFDGEEGEWSMPEPFLSYRQLFDNQSDAGSLIRRAVFDAGIEFDETMTDGFEDWEFFLRAALAGFRGAQAGRCGFRYRRRSESMLTQAQRQSDAIEAGLRDRHVDAYRPEALVRREHAEGPRFGLVRCDAGDVLLTAACDLEPHRMPLSGLLRPRRTTPAAPPLEAHVPAVSVLTTAATLAWLERQGLLAQVLLQLQIEVHTHAVVGLRLERGRSALRHLRQRQRDAAAGPAALALRTRTLAKLALEGTPVRAGEFVELQARRRPPAPLPEPLLERAVSQMRAAMVPGAPLVREGSQAEFFEHRHVDLLETDLPWSGEHQADGREKIAA